MKLLSPLLLATALALPAAASAQLPGPPPSQAPAPGPAGGKMSVRVSGGIATRKVRYVARGATVVVQGRVTPYVAGQSAVLEVIRGGKVVSRQSAPIAKGPGNTGRVRFAFRTRRRGSLRLRARHDATPQQKAFAAREVRLRSVVLRAGQGSRGTKVLVLQRGLRRLGFAVPVTGSYDAGTSRAVLAFRKTNRFARNGYASPRIYSMVLRGRGAFRLRHPRAGRHVEFDWSRQVLVLADKGRARRVYHSSSGAPATPTVFGAFRFYRKDFGTNSKGMVHSSYFIGGYAIHGYKSVPVYPASHGCLRVPIPDAAAIFRQIRLGQRIFVYR
jgi:peptidoglycan hydrolase-like protein with peptidoglycan-binding domain